MKKKFRINGTLPNENEVVLGYVETVEEVNEIIKEYVEVFGTITFRIKLVTMLSYEKGTTIINLLCALTGQPKSNFNSMYNQQNNLKSWKI